MSSSVLPAAALGTPLWNDSAAKTCFFDALSILFPVGEEFIMAATEAAACTLPLEHPLQAQVRHFVAEEKAHQRAHRLYNQRLSDQGYPVARLEKLAESDLQTFSSRMSVHQRLSLAAAFEHITSFLSKEVLRSGSGLLSGRLTPQSRMWRWHCEEEMAHAHVTLDLMRACKVPAWRRFGAYLMATALLAGDVVFNMREFRKVDLERKPQQAKAEKFWPSPWGWLRRGLTSRRMAVDWARYFLPLSWLSPPVSRDRDAPTGQPFPFPALPAEPSPPQRQRESQSCPPLRKTKVRFLEPGDVPALLRLESRKWEPGQAADGESLHRRINQHPQLSLAAFDAETGEALASLFMKPTTKDLLMQSANWNECASLPPEKIGRDLFGISFSSVDPDAGDAIFEFFWPHALKAGWRHIYLGSPVPGFSKWLAKHPEGSIYRYVHGRVKKKKRLEWGGVPVRDPQLRYYHGRGFRKIIYIRPDYFPHKPSMNYGVLLRGTVPLSMASPLWRCLPLSWLRAMKKGLFVLL